MKIFTSCVAQKYGDIKADISQINELSFNDTFNKWKELTKGETPALNVYRGYSWEFIKSIATKVPIQVISAGYGIIDINDLIVPYKITFSNKSTINNSGVYFFNKRLFKYIKNVFY